MDADDSAIALRQTLEDRLATGDQPAAVLATLAAVRDGTVDLASLYAHVLGPLLADVGGQWCEGETRVWQEHLTTASVRTIVEALFPVVREQASRARRRGVAVLACPPEEQHDLGLRMLGDRLALAGWDTRFLGADTPVIEIAAAARALDAVLVVLSTSTHFGRVHLASYAGELRTMLPAVRVVVGGPAFERDREGWTSDDFLGEADLRPLEEA